MKSGSRIRETAKVGSEFADNQGMKQRILVVDDEPQMRELLSMYLTQKGFQANVAGSADEALRKIREKPVDCVVLDINLGGEDGLQILANLKAFDPKLRVIMLTGMGFVEDFLQEAQQKGADGYVSKELPLDELVLALHKALGTKKRTEAAAA
ncbi:MAG TPA: response regulator [Verrucomicrobiae bacterium]|nr:response regulator [Verrucomicrobiae bacterium]